MIDDKVEVIEKETVKNKLRNLCLRLHRAVGPIAGGLILDLFDIATFGPLGLIIGPFIGGIVGWYIAKIYGFSKWTRRLWTIFAAIYCTIPFTALLPVATIISAIARFGENPDKKSNTNL